MTFPEFLVAALAIVSTFGFGAFFVHRITSLARFRMERKYGSASPEQLEQLNALKEWKTKAEHRLRVLEQIVSEEDLPSQDEIKPLIETQMMDHSEPNSNASRIPNQLRNH
jgi:hypothetical protein